MSRLSRRLLGVALSAALGFLGAGNVLAVPVSISGLQAPDGTVNFTVSDDNPQDMCSLGLCFGDFTVNYDPAVLAFGSAALGDALSPVGFLLQENVVLGGPQGAQVLISLIGLDPAPVPFPGYVLFSLGFLPLVDGTANVSIEPTDFGTGDPPTYAFDADRASLQVTAGAAQVPEPASHALVALALAGAWTARRRDRQVGARVA